MSSGVEKLSVSVPKQVWREAMRLLRPDSSESNSAFVSRVLRDAVLHAKESAYERGYAEHPPIDADNALGEVLVEQAAAELRVEEEAAHLPLMGGRAAYEEWKRWRAAR
jgi:hypothetical protein